MVAALGVAVGAGLSMLIVLAFEHTGLAVLGMHLSFFQVQFIVSTVVRIVAIGLLLPRIEDVQARPCAQNVRLMLYNMYSLLGVRRLRTAWISSGGVRALLPRRRDANTPNRRSRAA